jgi:hypothetical protein
MAMGHIRLKFICCDHKTSKDDVIIHLVMAFEAVPSVDIIKLLIGLCILLSVRLCLEIKEGFFM